MSSRLRLIAAAVTTVVAALAIGQASAQSYGNSDYGYSNNGYTGNGYSSSSYGYGRTRSVRCESIGSRRAFCRVDTRGGVRIARQLSQRSCIQGRNWSYDSRGIWVSGGCRADFAISSRRDRRGDGYTSNGYYSNGYGSNGYDSNDSRYQNNDYRDRGYRNPDPGYDDNDYNNDDPGYQGYHQP